MSDKPACCFRTWLGLQCAVRIIQAREDWFGQRQQIPTLSDARVHVSLDREGRCGRLTDRAFAVARNSNDNERNASLKNRRRQLQGLVRRQNARRLLTDAGAERLADLPVMTEGVDDPAHETAVLFVHRPHFGCSSSHRSSVNGLRVPYDQHEASRSTA